MGNNSFYAEKGHENEGHWIGRDSNQNELQEKGLQILQRVLLLYSLEYSLPLVCNETASDEEGAEGTMPRAPAGTELVPAARVEDLEVKR